MTAFCHMNRKHRVITINKEKEKNRLNIEERKQD